MNRINKLHNILNNGFKLVEDWDILERVHDELSHEYFKSIFLKNINFEKLDFKFLGNDSKQIFENIVMFIFSLLNCVAQVEVEKGEVDIEMIDWPRDTLNALLKRLEIILVEYYVNSTSRIKESSNLISKSDQLKLYMHCLFEIKQFWDIYSLNENRDNNKAAYKLMSIFDSRTVNNNEALDLVYWVRTHLFASANRNFECGFWMMQRIKLLKKIQGKHFEIINLFEWASFLKDFIQDLELEKVKYFIKQKEWNYPVTQLENNIDEIRKFIFSHNL